MIRFIIFRGSIWGVRLFREATTSIKGIIQKGVTIAPPLTLKPKPSTNVELVVAGPWAKHP